MFVLNIFTNKYIISGIDITYNRKKKSSINILSLPGFEPGPSIVNSNSLDYSDFQY